MASETDDLDVGLFIYNAAFAAQGLFVDTPLDDHLFSIAMNVTTPTVLADAARLKMRDRGRGGIVLVSSGAAHGGMKIFTTYVAGKAYELILGEGLWDELRDSGVDVLGYVVGATATPTFEKSTEADAAKATNADARGGRRRALRGPRQGSARVSHPGDEEREQAGAARPRAEVVAATGEMISAIWH